MTEPNYDRVAPETQTYLNSLPADERAKIPTAVIDPAAVSQHTENDTFVQAVDDGDLTPEEVAEDRYPRELVGLEFAEPAEVVVEEEESPQDSEEEDAGSE